MESIIKLQGLIIHLLFFTCILVTSANKKGGILLTDESGVITSPGYPNSYPNSIAFIWLINTTQSKYIELTFVDFDVEPYRDCSVDYVKIRNKKPTHGNFKDVPQIDAISKESSINFTTKGPFCNTHKPPKIVLSGSNMMAIVFISDSSVSHRGFKATYRSLDMTACGAIMNDNHGVIMTPGFPLTYPREGECVWQINAKDDEYIRLEFNSFELEYNSQLCMDEIIVWDGKTSSSPILLRGCRIFPSIIYSTSHHLRIKFTSRGYHLKRGFKAFYTTTATKGCGGNFYAENGTLVSPNYNLEAGYTYPAFSDCLWTVIAPKDDVISFRFSYFDVMAGSTGFCDEDFVQIFDGPNSKTRPIGKYCNIEKPNVITSSGNSMTMRFVSNARRHGKGFYVEYRTHKTDCQSPLGMEDGRIPSNKVSASSFLRESPHFRPDSGRLNGPFTWCSQPQVNNQVGEFLQIDLLNPIQVTAIATQGYMMTGARQSYYITKYKLMYSNNDGQYFKTYIIPSTKNSDYKIKIFHGNSDSVGIMKNQLEQPLVAKMFRIVPLGYVHGRKRTICTKVEIYGCKFQFGDGYLLQSLNGHISYHGKETSPKSNSWIISSSAIYMNSAIYIMPLYFKVDCEKAVLTISDGVQNNSFCGNKRPPLHQLYSGNGQLKISLQSLKDNLHGQEFGLEFFTENLGTGRVLRSPRGLVRGIRSLRSVPATTRNASKSTWIISVPPGRRIAAKFTSMKLGIAKAGQCEDYVEIKDGLFGSSKTFGNFCRGVPMNTVLTSQNVMRVEFHTKLKSSRSKRDLASTFVTFEMVYTSLQFNASSEMLILSAEERTKRRSKEKNVNTGIQNGYPHCTLPTVVALVLAALCIVLPT